MKRMGMGGRPGVALGLAAVLVCCCALSSCNKVQANQNAPNGQTKGNAQDQILSGPLKFMAAWGTKGKDPGQFQSPEWLATDATGNVFVADADAKAIEKFTFDGHPLMSFNDAPLPEPFRVAVDSGAGIYALSRNVNAFYIFSPEGEPFRHYPIVAQHSGQRPDGIAVNSSGDIFVVVAAGDGANGAKHDGLGNVTTQSEIRQYNSHGHLARTLSGNPADKTFSAGSVSAGPDGNLYVLDVTATRIEKFSDDGKMIAAWGGQPPAEGVPGNPISPGMGIAVTSKYVFTPEPLNRGIRVWTVAGDARIVDDLGGRLQSTNGNYQVSVNASKEELVILDMAGAKIYRFHIDF